MGYSTYVLHRTVGRDRHRIDMCGGTHGSPWDNLPTSYSGQWNRIDIGLTCAMVHMGVAGISYIKQWDGIDRHIGLTCVVVHMGVPLILYLHPT